MKKIVSSLIRKLKPTFNNTLTTRNVKIR